MPRASLHAPPPIISHTYLALKTGFAALKLQTTEAERRERAHPNPAAPHPADTQGHRGSHGFEACGTSQSPWVTNAPRKNRGRFPHTKPNQALQGALVDSPQRPRDPLSRPPRRESRAELEHPWRCSPPGCGLVCPRLSGWRPCWRDNSPREACRLWPNPAQVPSA